MVYIYFVVFWQSSKKRRAVKFTRRIRIYAFFFSVLNAYLLLINHSILSDLQLYCIEFTLPTDRIVKNTGVEIQNFILQSYKITHQTPTQHCSDDLSRLWLYDLPVYFFIWLQHIVSETRKTRTARRDQKNLKKHIFYIQVRSWTSHLVLCKENLNFVSFPTPNSSNNGHLITLLVIHKKKAWICHSKENGKIVWHTFSFKAYSSGL